MKKSKIGKVDYSALKNPPEKHERTTANYFAKNIIFDLRRLNKRDEHKYLRELIKRGDSRTIKSLIAITKDGRMVDIKGKVC